MSKDVNAVSRVRMHRNGPELSGVIWGSMRMQSQFSSLGQLTEHLNWLHEQGITTLDTASVYGDPDPFSVEEELGEAIAQVATNLKLSRNAGSSGFPGSGPKTAFAISISAQRKSEIRPNALCANSVLTRST